MKPTIIVQWLTHSLWMTQYIVTEYKFKHVINIVMYVVQKKYIFKINNSSGYIRPDVQLKYI